MATGQGDTMHNSFDHQDLTGRGFVGFQLLHQLPRRCQHIPSDSGIYVANLEPPVTGFLPRSVGGHCKGSDPTVPVARLEDKRLEGVPTLYIGRATDLRKRVDLLARYGRGEPVGHQGGRYLWQIAEHDNLRVAWKLDSDPVGAEAELLDEFEAAYGQLPFANLVRGSRPLAVA
jgi:hypothetical protein